MKKLYSFLLSLRNRILNFAAWRRIAVVVVFAGTSFFLNCNFVFAQGAWTQKVNFFGTGRVSAVAFSIEDKGYVGTGSDGNIKKDFWEYDFLNNIWTQKADFSGIPRSVAVGFSIGSFGYIGTGWDSTSNLRNDFWEYNKGTNAWSQKNNFGGSARYAAVAFSIGNKGYVGTGWGINFKNDFWEYDPSTDSWTPKTDFPGAPRYYAVGISINAKGYIGTGKDSTGNLLNDFWEYNPSADTWTQKSNFGGTPRWVSTGFSIGNFGYIGTGGDSNNLINDLWQYDQTNDNWAEINNAGNTARYGSISFSIGAKGYFGLGEDADSLRTDFYEFDPCAVFSVSTTSTPDSGNANGTATVAASGGTSPYSYLWNTGDTTSTIYNLQSSIYNITITDANGCEIVDSVFVDFYVGDLSHILHLNTHFSIIPNPNDGTFILQRTTDSGQRTTIKIYNILGEIVYKSQISNPKSQIDISHLPSGIYFLQLTTENTRQTLKIIVE